MSFPNFGRLLLVTAIACCVSVLISKKADAGQFSKIVAIVVATDDGKVVMVPVKETAAKPVVLKASAAPAKIAANPFRPVAATTTTVCGPDGCKTVETTAAAGCPCKCSDCTCNTPASTPTTTTTTTVTSHAAGNCSAGPVRRVLGRVGKFVVRGGPIRQALRANRQARRGH